MSPPITWTLILSLGWKNFYPNIQEPSSPSPMTDTFLIMLPDGFWKWIEEIYSVTREIIHTGSTKNKNESPWRCVLVRPLKRGLHVSWNGLTQLLLPDKRRTERE